MLPVKLQCCWTSLSWSNPICNPKTDITRTRWNSIEEYWFFSKVDTMKRRRSTNPHLISHKGEPLSSSIKLWLKILCDSSGYPCYDWLDPSQLHIYSKSSVVIFRHRVQIDGEQLQSVWHFIWTSWLAMAMAFKTASRASNPLILFISSKEQLTLKLLQRSAGLARLIKSSSRKFIAIPWKLHSILCFTSMNEALRNWTLLIHGR